MPITATGQANEGCEKIFPTYPAPEGQRWECDWPDGVHYRCHPVDCPQGEQAAASSGEGSTTCTGSGEPPPTGAPDEEEDICSAPAAGTPTTTSAMDMSQNGLEFLEGHEGNAGVLPAARRLTRDNYGLYNDPAGHCTVGIGHLVHRGPCTPQDVANYRAENPNGLGRDGALQQLAVDLDVAEVSSSSACQCRFDPRTI